MILYINSSLWYTFIRFFDDYIFNLFIYNSLQTFTSSFFCSSVCIGRVDHINYFPANIFMFFIRSCWVIMGQRFQKEFPIIEWNIYSCSTLKFLFFDTAVHVSVCTRSLQFVLKFSITQYIVFNTWIKINNTWKKVGVNTFLTRS